MKNYFSAEMYVFVFEFVDDSAILAGFFLPWNIGMLYLYFLMQTKVKASSQLAKGTSLFIET